MSVASVPHFRLFGIDWHVAPGHRSDTWVYVSYWIFASPIILSSFNDNFSVWGMIGRYIYMIVAYTTYSWLAVNVLFPSYMPERRYFLGFFGVLVLMLACASGSQLTDVILLGERTTFWQSVLKYEMPNDSQNVLTIVAILAGKKFFDERQRNTALESERRQSELQRLRAQVDPHFLFNALNILDILIEDDPPEARHFVHRLSNLYRYLIRHRDEDLVPAAAELAYARDYHYLVERRFGNSFRFRENLTPADLEDRYLPPGSLQTVLENVYKHNLATERSPVTVNVDLRHGALYVSNDYSPKPGELATHERSGSGTANLVRRYALLTDDAVYARREGDYWIVRLPLLQFAPPPTESTPAAARPQPDALNTHP